MQACRFEYPRAYLSEPAPSAGFARYDRAEVPAAPMRRSLLHPTVWLSLAALHCAPIQLVPLNPRAGGGAIAHAEGVEVRADADGARRSWSVPSAYAALYLTVRNTGASPLFVELDDIELRTEDRVLRALAPDSVAPRRRVASLGMDPASPFIALQSPGAQGRYGRTESVVLEPNPSSPVARSDRLSRAGVREIAAAAFVAGRIAGGQAREGLVYFRQPPGDAKALRLRVGVRPHSIGADARYIEIAYTIRG